MRSPPPRRVPLGIPRSAHLRGKPFARALQALQKPGGREVERLSRLGMRKACERNQQQSLAQFQRQGSNRAGDRRAPALNGRFGPKLLAFLKDEAPDMPPIELNETCVAADAAAQANSLRLVYRRNGRLADEFVREPAGADIVEHEPLVTRERDPKASQAAGIVNAFSIRGHLRRDPER
jgi:hypothetical protein